MGDRRDATVPVGFDSSVASNAGSNDGGKAPGSVDGSTDGGPLEEVECEAGEIVIRGTLTEMPFARKYSINTRQISPLNSSHDLSAWGTMDVVWGERLAISASAKDASFDLVMPYSDATLPAVTLCATSVTTKRQSSAYIHQAAHVARVACPGVAVSGELNATPTSLKGTVDGTVFDEPIRGAQFTSGRMRLLAFRSIRLEVDDRGTDAPSGKVTSGYFKGDDGHYYVSPRCCPYRQRHSLRRPCAHDDSRVEASVEGMAHRAPTGTLPS